MKNLLINYMSKRHEAQEQEEKADKQQPVITLSREYGCPTNEIIKYLREGLENQHKLDNQAQQWVVVTKEILNDAAEELNVKPEKLEYVFRFEKRTVMDEILGAMSSKYYKSDKRIRKTIRSVIETFARQGNCIIVGRGGVAITQGYPNALHFRLQAPLYWRAHNISQNENLGYKEAERRAVDMDKRRSGLIEDFLGKPLDNSLFDVVYNCRTLTARQIADSMVHIISLKNPI